MDKFIFHGIPNLVGSLFSIAFVWFCAVKFKRKGYKDKLKPLIFLYAMLMILEVIKIFYHITVQGAYPPQRYPIVFCSLIMFTYPIICHSKKETMAVRISKALSIIPCIVIGVCYLFILPDVSSGFSTYSFVMNLHSRFYHFCMLAGALYMIFVKLYDFRFKDFFASGLTVGGYFLLCTILSLFIGGNLSYFGPTSAPVQFLYQAVGYAVGNIILSIVAMLLSFLSFALINLCIFLNKKHKTSHNLKNLL